jgi:hypothetical protein
MDNNETRLSLTQSENLKIGERGVYVFRGPKTKSRAERLGITCWVQKTKAPITDSDKALREFIDIPVGYKLEYGINYKGREFVCGDCPRDLGSVIIGIEIAELMQH